MIHLLLNHNIILVRVVADSENIPKTVGVRWEYILDRMLVHHRKS